MGKPLRFEMSGLHSARRGPYRVVYRIDDDVVVVEIIRLSHRADVSS